MDFEKNHEKFLSARSLGKLHIWHNFTYIFLHILFMIYLKKHYILLYYKWSFILVSLV
jgi:hypothetical protein